jgi:hypothetical protein
LRLAPISSVDARIVVCWGVRFFIVCCLGALMACASSGGQAAQQGKSRSSADVITRDEIQQAHWQSAYELIQTLRPRWLRAHGAETILGKPPDVQVHLDENLLGGVATLRNIATNGIMSIQFVDPVSAAARWGGDHANGAIIVSTSTTAPR